MHNLLNPINKPVDYPSELFVDEKGKYTPGKVMTCQMGGDSMQPTIQPCELIAFADCGGKSQRRVFMFLPAMFSGDHAYSLSVLSHCLTVLW
jgi:predicted metal-binding protein